MLAARTWLCRIITGLDLKRLQTWKTDTFEIWTHRRCEEKLGDLVGLHMNPLECAVVFSFDETT